MKEQIIAVFDEGKVWFDEDGTLCWDIIPKEKCLRLMAEEILRLKAELNEFRANDGSNS